ncbi:MAG: hypothetical protein ACI37T_00170 [Candidatus Gastranaerophilaceae bacterium]
MKWFEVKERSAGRKRLILTYFLYKFLGRKILKVIAFFVTFFTFLTATDLRRYSKKNQRILGLKPSLKNTFCNFLNYALAQVDKIEVFSKKFDINNILINGDVEKFYSCIKSSKGAVCIFSHVGNIEIMRALLKKDNVKVSAFMSKKQAQIFRNFLESFSDNQNFSIYAVEEIGLNTIIELKQKIDNGEFVFLAGDRISKTAAERKIEVIIFGEKVDFPLGSYKFAELLDVPVFFVAALKQKNLYNIIVKNFKTSKKCASKMAFDFAAFLSDCASTEPLQFYHFYDFFKENE